MKAIGSGSLIEDVSDDPDDDTTATEDPTVIVIVPEPSIEVTKTVFEHQDNDGDGLYTAGDVIVYLIAVENTGNISQQNLVFNESLTNFTPTNLTLNTFSTGEQIRWESSSKGSSENYIKSGEIAYYKAEYTITADDVTSGGISNSVQVNTNNFDSSQVISTDISDDGDDTDNNTTDDPTIIYTGILPSIEVQKIGAFNDLDTISGASLGDQIVFTITVTNTGAGCLLYTSPSPRDS